MAKPERTKKPRLFGDEFMAADAEFRRKYRKNPKLVTEVSDLLTKLQHMDMWVFCAIQREVMKREVPHGKV